MSAAGQTLRVNGILASGGSAAINMGNLQPAAAGGELVVRVNNSSDQLSIGSIVQNNGSASSLTKGGAGVLTLSAANTLLGPDRRQLRQPATRRLD